MLAQKLIGVVLIVLSCNLVDCDPVSQLIKTPAQALAAGFNGLAQYTAPNGPLAPGVTAVSSIPVRVGENINLGLAAISRGMQQTADTISNRAGVPQTVPGFEQARSMIPTPVNSMLSQLRQGISAKNNFVRDQARAGVDSGNRMMKSIETNNLPGNNNVPGMASLQNLNNYIPGLQNIPGISSLQNLNRYIPGMQNLPNMNSLNNVPGMQNLPNMNSLNNVPGMQNLPSINGLSQTAQNAFSRIPRSMQQAIRMPADILNGLRGSITPQ